MQHQPRKNRSICKSVTTRVASAPQRAAAPLSKRSEKNSNAEQFRPVPREGLGKPCRHVSRSDARMHSCCLPMTERCRSRAWLKVAQIQNVALQHARRVERIDKAARIALRRLVHQSHCGTSADMYFVNRRWELRRPSITGTNSHSSADEDG